MIWFLLAAYSKTSLEREKLKKDLLTKKGIRTWRLGKICGISWLQKELKLGNSLLGKCVQEWKPRVCVAGQPFASTSEISKAQSTKSHRGSLKRLGMWLIHPLHLLSRSQNKKYDYPGRTCGGASCLREWIPLIYTWDSQVSGNVIPAETLRPWTEKDQKGQTKEDCQTSKFSRQETGS